MVFAATLVTSDQISIKYTCIWKYIVGLVSPNFQKQKIWSCRWEQFEWPLYCAFCPSGGRPGSNKAWSSWQVFPYTTFFSNVFAILFDTHFLSIVSRVEEKPYKDHLLFHFTAQETQMHVLCRAYHSETCAILKHVSDWHGVSFWKMFISGACCRLTPCKLCHIEGRQQHVTHVAFEIALYF